MKLLFYILSLCLFIGGEWIIRNVESDFLSSIGCTMIMLSVFFAVAGIMA